MTRMRLALTFTAVSMATGAIGCAVGMLFAPASGNEVRRRLAWRARRQYRSMGRTSERMFERAATRAGHELQATAERVTKQVSKALAG